MKNERQYVGVYYRENEQKSETNFQKSKTETYSEEKTYAENSETDEGREDNKY